MRKEVLLEESCWGPKDYRRIGGSGVQHVEVGIRRGEAGAMGIRSLHELLAGSVKRAMKNRRADEISENDTKKARKTGVVTNSNLIFDGKGLQGRGGAVASGRGL